MGLSLLFLSFAVVSVGNIGLCFKKPAKKNNTRVHEDKSIYCALSARSEMQLIYKTGIIIMSGFTASLPGLGVDRYVFFRADTDTDYYRSSRPITDILNRYTCLV